MVLGYNTNHSSNQRLGDIKMIRFTSKEFSTITFKVMDDDVHRFTVIENQSFRGGWDLYTPEENLHIGWFETLCEVETYVEEMDK